MKILSVLLAAALAMAAQEPSPEENDLRQAMGEAGSSTLEIVRALERHLRKYPDSKRRDEIERTLVKSAIDLRDPSRIVKYGELYLAKNPGDPLALERVTRILTTRTDRPSNERALKYAKSFETIMRDFQKQRPEGRVEAQMIEDLDRGVARALLFQAQAQANLGNREESLALARRGFETFPSAELAREIGRAFLRLDRHQEAVPPLADAFVLPESRYTDEDRQAIRRELGDAWRKSHANEQGLGDAVLAAYDRSIQTQEKLKARLAAADPNAGKKSAMQYTLAGVDGSKLQLETLKGKVVVLDFWATWCGPCRVQYPMYERVKESFREKKDVVFLGINTDEDRSVVRPFLAEQKWNKSVYFEDGLQGLLEVRSIPTTLIFNRKGELASRLNGFLPERFVDMLTQRITDALAEE